MTAKQKLLYSQTLIRALMGAETLEELQARIQLDFRWIDLTPQAQEAFDAWANEHVPGGTTWQHVSLSRSSTPAR